MFGMALEHASTMEVSSSCYE